jgi:hypothetical protein
LFSTPDSLLASVECRSGATVQDKRERWMELAELAANEQDSEKLLELVEEINELLDRKLNRLHGEKPFKPAE